MKAINYPCDLVNIHRTTSNEDDISPYKIWYGTAPTLNQLRLLGTVGYTRIPTTEHKLVSSGTKYIKMGITHKYARGTVEKGIVNNGKVVCHQDVSWHPEYSEFQRNTSTCYLNA